MAGIDASINLEIKGGSKLDRLINRASQLDGIVQNINKVPIELNVKAATSNFDKLDSELKALQLTTKNTEKAIDAAESAISSYALEIAATQSKLNKLNPNTKAYNQTLEKQQKAIKGLATAHKDLNENAARLESLANVELPVARRSAKEAASIKKVSEALQNLADDYLKVGYAQTRGQRGQVVQTRDSSISQLNAEADALKLLSNNTKIASSEFNRFAIASELAGKRVFEARQKQLSAIAFGFSPKAAQVNIGVKGEGSIAAARSQINDLVGLYPQIAKSEAALSSYGDELRRLQSLVPYTSQEFKTLEDAIAELNQEISRIGLRGQRSSITLPQPIKALGPTSKVEGTLKDREKYAVAVNKEYQKQLDLVDKINESFLDSSKKESFSLQVNRALDALAENRLETAQEITREITRQFNIEAKIAKQRPAEVQTTPKGLAVELGGGAQVAETLKTSRLIAKAQKDIADATELAANAGQRLVGLENSQALRAGLDDYLSGLQNVEDAAGRVLSAEKAAIGDFDRRLKESVAASQASKKEAVDEADARAQIATRINQVQKLQNDYVSLEEQGVKFLQEKADLQALVNRLTQNSVTPTKENSKALQQQLDYYRSLLALRTSEAKLAGTFSGTTKATAPEKAESLRKRLLGRALDVQSQFIGLESRGADVASEKLKIEQTILDIKNLQNRATQGQLELLAQQILDLKNIGKETSNLTPRGGSGRRSNEAGSGLEQAIESLRNARAAREKFLGGVSPAQGIDKIVREFNTGKSEAGDAAGNVAQTFAANLRKGIPEAVAASAALAGASIDAILKKLGIKSPSRVMIEIARNLVDTYVSVLGAAIPEIEQASQKAFAAPTNLDVENATSFPLPKRQEIIDAIGQSVASFVDPMQSRGFSEYRASELIMQKGKQLAPRNIPGIDYSAAENAAAKGSYNDPEFQKVRKAFVEFYNIPREFAPDIERASNAAGQASEDAKRLEAEVAALVSGLEQVSGLFRGAADLVRAPGLPAQQKTATDLVGDYWSNAAIDAKELDDRLKREFTGSGTNRAATLVDFWDTSFEEAQKIARKADEAAAEAAKLQRETSAPFQASAQKASEIDDQRRRQATFDAFAAARQQAEADARAASEAIASQIVEPVKKSAPEGERRIQAALSSLFDRVSQAFGGLGGFGGSGGGGRGGGGGFGGAGGGAGDFGRRFEEAVAQGPEAVLGLKELAKPATASIKELEALSAVLKEFRAILDPTSEGFDRLEKQLRETAANLDRQLERRAPDADFLTRRFGSRGGRAVSEGLVGGAFPLLFGQGLGASVLGGLGGAAGGFAGGGLGFGLSLVGTALGTAFDTAVQGATELGAALTDTTATFDKVKERALFSSTQTEKFAGKLQEAGLVASAAVISQQEIISKIGRTGVQSLQQLAGSSDRLNRAWAEFSLQLQTALAGPMAGLLEWVSKVLNLANQESRSRAAVADIGAGLSGTKKQEFEQRRIDIEMRRGGIGASILRDLGIGNFLSDEEANNLRAQLVDEFKDFSVPVKLKPAADATQKTEQEIAILTKKLETTDIGKSLKDQVRQAAREQRDLDKQRADLVRSYEESISQIRQDVESRILQQRRENAETEIDLRARSAELELAKIKQANQEFRGLFADTTAGQVTDQLLNAVETVAQIQNDSATQRAKLELDIQNSVVDTEKYKIQIADQVSKLNLDTAQKVSDINEQVRQRNEEYDSTRFTLEKKIAQFKLSQERISFESKIKGFEVALKQSKALGETDAAQGIQNAIDVYRAQLDAVKKGEGEIKAISAPGKLKGVGAVGGSSVSTRGISEALQAGNNLKVALQDIADLISQIDSETALSSITDQLDKQVISSSKLFEQYRQGGGVRSKDLAAEQVLVDAINQQIQSQIGKNNELVKRLQDLLNLENGRPAIINKIRQAQNEAFKSDKLIEFIQSNNELKLELEAQMNVFGRLTEVQKLQAEAQARGIDLSDQNGQALLREAAAADELARKLETVQQVRSMAESLSGTIGQGIQDAFLGATGLGGIQERFDLQHEISQFEKLRAKTEEGTDEYKRYTDQINQAKLKMNELSNAGAQVKDALSRMMQGIADAFAEMAAEIIAKQTLMIILGSVLKALGIASSAAGASYASGNVATDAFSGGGGIPGITANPASIGTPGGAFAFDPAVAGSFSGLGFAKGGMFTNSIVSSPTLFKFANGGISRTGVMGEAGPEAIIPLSRGADGRLGVDATGFSDAISEARDALDEASDAMAQGDGAAGLELSGGASDGYGAMGLKSGEAQGKMSRATAMAISDSRGAVEMIKRITQENDAKAAAAAASASPETRELYKLLATKDSNTIREITNNQTGSADGTDQFAAGSQQQLAYGDAISAARGVLASEISGGEPDQMQQVGEAGAITNSREFIEKITDRISSPDSSKKAEASAFGDSRNAVGKSSGSQSAISTKETISALMQARDSRETSSAISQTREVLSSVSSMNKEKNMERVMESNVTAITKPLDIKYESQMINNVEYVTVDQYQRGLAEAAERGRALTLSSLKNSVKARRQIGI